MSVIGGQNTPSTNGLAYIIDFNNNYTSGSSTVNPILYFPTASQFTGSVPNLVNGQVQFATGSVLRSFQNFPGFNPNTGNLTIMFSGEIKNNAVLFTQDGQIAVVGTTSSIGYGVPAGNVGRNFPNTGFDHVALRFSTASVDCFVNGLPISASGIFPTVPSSSTFTDFKIGGNYLTSWTGSLSGSLGQLMVYTRPLSDDEIYSNYLIQARRYGLSEAPKPYTVDSSVYVYSQAAGITDTVTLNALNTFVQGLKSASLWDKMVAIYPFIGTNPSASRLNLKDVSLNTTQVNYSGSWSTSLSGSRNNNTASYGILSNVKGDYYHPLISSQSIHLSYLSYDTPVSGGFAIGAVTGSTGIESGSAIFISPTEISSSANNILTGSLVTGGPIGLITVSRTGSNNFKLWKNRVPTTITARASSSIDSELYLNAANVNNTLFSSSQNNIAYASVGAGLTDDEVYTYYELVDNLQSGLNKRVADPTAFVSVWDTTKTGTGTISNTSSIVLPFVGTPLVTASWGDGTVSFISQSTQLAVTHSYTTPGIYTVTVTGNHSGFRFNTTGDRAKIIDITQWGSNAINGGLSAYAGCFNLVGTAADAPAAPTDLQWVFLDASRFKGYVNHWNTSQLSGLNQAFRNASSFNSPLDRWDVSKVTAFSLAFNGSAFNQPIGNWRFTTSSTYLFTSTFAGTPFNQNIGAWNVEKASGMGGMFSNATSFNNGGSPDINNWRPISCSSFASMFQSARAFNQPVGNWPLSASSIDMGSMFRDADAFNQNIGSWDVSRVTSMAAMFQDNSGFNNSGSSDINNWRPVSCSNFSSMFYNAPAFNQPIGNWPLSASNITLSSMFRAPNSFNQNLGSWDVSKVTNMSFMFTSNGVFNNSGSSDINNWRPISCSNFSSMFQSATAFNQPIGNWPLSASNINMSQMFYAANLFNQSINTWNTSKVTNMSGMFQFNTGFNQPLNLWNVSSVTTMRNMFNGATAFNQNIGSWDVGKVTDFSSFMSGKSSADYSYLHTIYDGWINNKLQPNRTINFSTINYSSSAVEGKALLERTYNTASIIGSNDDTGQIAITCSANHNVVAGNKIFISGSSYPGINGVQIVFATGSATTLTITGVPYDPSATNGLVITGYGWNITDGNPV